MFAIFNNLVNDANDLEIYHLQYSQTWWIFQMMLGYIMFAIFNDLVNNANDLGMYCVCNIHRLGKYCK